MTDTDGFDVKALARTLLAGQEEPDDLPVPPLAHWVGILENRKPLAAEETAILAVSPISRARLALARHNYRAVYLKRAANSNNMPIMQAAASSAGRRLIRFAPMKDFSLAIEPSGPDGWLIVCDVRTAFPTGSHVELIDRDGTVWLSGSPNEDGRIVARHEGVANPLDARAPFAIRVDGIELG